MEYIGMATGSVLLVDDEQSDREQIRRTFGDGFSIIEAATYQEALAVSHFFTPRTAPGAETPPARLGARP